MELQKETPKGKRTIRNNIYGNLVGYVAGKRWEEFGDCYSEGNKRAAALWAEGMDFDEARIKCYE